MEDINQRLSRLLQARELSPEDEQWLSEYLDNGANDAMQLEALKIYSADLASGTGQLGQKESGDILNGIHSHIHVAPAVKMRRWDWLLAMAAVLLIMLSAGYLFRTGQATRKAGTAFLQVSAKQGEQKKIMLEDGTEVWLNSASVIKYPARFAANKREISFSGEAYFKVKHIEGRPFVIHTGKVVTNVLGTSFNIRAYKGDKNIEVAVITGKVGVSVKGKPSQLIVRNQQIVFNLATDQLNKPVKLAATEKILWTEGKLHFKNAPLPQVISELQRKYNVNIAIDTSMVNCTVYANFDNEPIDKVLKLLAETTNSDLKNENNGYKLQGTGCSGK